MLLQTTHTQKTTDFEQRPRFFGVVVRGAQEEEIRYHVLCVNYRNRIVKVTGIVFGHFVCLLYGRKFEGEIPCRIVFGGKLTL